MRLANSTHPAFAQTDHRPWPLPDKSYLLKQIWLDLAFIHWEVPYEQLRTRIPKPLEIETFAGKAWLGIVPFDMQGVTFRGLPAIPALSDFPEINVRTYVKYGDKPGVWFFSLDVPNPIAVWAARTFFNLPYRRAQVSIKQPEAGVINYTHRLPGASFKATYRPIAAPTYSHDSFARWATERYCLYCQSQQGNLYRTAVQHPQWLLQAAELTIHENTLLNDFDIGPQHPTVLFSKRQDVVAYTPERIQFAQPKVSI